MELLQSSKLHLSHTQPDPRGTVISGKLKQRETNRRRIILTKVDKELSKGNHKTALSLIKHMQGFGFAKQVPRTIRNLNDLKLESLQDQILTSIKSSTKLLLSDEVTLVELESLITNGTKCYDSMCQNHLMCMQHEAGHFLVGYLLGVLPKRYKVSNMKALTSDKLGVAGGSVQFLGFEFLKETYSGKNDFSRRGLHDDVVFDKFMCVILAGLVAEHLVFGYSRGFHSDLEKLHKVVKSMGLTDIEADNKFKWAIRNDIIILHRHQEARSRLAEAMGLGKSVGSCIHVIENYLNHQDV